MFILSLYSPRILRKRWRTGRRIWFLSESKSLSETTFQVLLEPEKVNMLVLYFLFISCYAVEAFFKCLHLFDSSVFAKRSSVAYAMPCLIHLCYDII